MQLQILGCRGIPARHGGFETFAENFSLYLREKGWDVTIYCQENGNNEIWADEWKGIKRVHIPISLEGAVGTVAFDWISTSMAARKKFPVLTLGYNTAVFCLLYRLKRVKNVINMDGVEWRRGKWSILERSWLYINEKLGAGLGNHLVADHPEIKKHLARFVSADKITVIPYSADILDSADEEQLSAFGLSAHRYGLLVARPEQENSILEIVRAWSMRQRGIPLVVLGDYTPKENPYHREVLEAAGEEVRFVGAIYESEVVQALRFFARFYIHGHTVGGTNPSLVEALGAGSPVLAHDNRFNRWVAGEGAVYFASEDECARRIERLLTDDKLVASMRKSSYHQISRMFTREKIHQSYETMLRQQFFG